MARILIAAAPEPRQVLERVLAGHELICAATLADAERLLDRQRVDLIICTIVFDDSRMYDLVRLAKSRPGWRQIPVACARVRKQVAVSPEARQAISSTCSLLGAAAFLDITEYQADPERELREAIERLLPVAGATTPQAPQPA